MFLAATQVRNIRFVRDSSGRYFDQSGPARTWPYPFLVCETYESTVPHQLVGCLFDNTTVGPQLSESSLSELSLIRTVLYTILLLIGKKLQNYSILLHTETIYKIGFVL